MKIKWSVFGNENLQCCDIRIGGVEMLCYRAAKSKYATGGDFYATINGAYLTPFAKSLNEAKAICQKHFDAVQKFFREGDPLGGYKIEPDNECFINKQALDDGSDPRPKKVKMAKTRGNIDREKIPTVYQGAIVIKIGKRKIGEVFPNLISWGYLHYARDSGNELLDTKAKAKKMLLEDEEEYQRSIKKKKRK